MLPSLKSNRGMKLSLGLTLWLFIVLLKFEGYYKNGVTTLVNDDGYEFPLHQPL